MTNLSIRQKIIVLVLGLNVALTAILSVTMFRNERAAVIRGIDEKLYSGATGIGEIFPDAYHAGVTGAGSVPEAEYQSYVRRLTDLARKNKFQWLYTYMEVNGQIVITSTSADLSDATHKPFLTVYEQPSVNLRRTFAERKPFFDEYTDEYGKVRSAFVPFVTSNGRVFVAGSDVSIDFIDKLLNQHLRGVLLLSLLVSASFVVLSVVVANRISRPIGRLAGLTTSLADRTFTLSEEQGQWLERISRSTHDEVGELASAFIRMDATLKTYIANLRETTAANERIESELNIARKIQDSFLHKLFPPFPDRTEFDLFAGLMPAKEVGGDLYDFMLMGDELYFCVGDVSDKGVPAALLMVVTQTLMRAAAQEPEVDPAVMLARVNADILEKNEMMMFVTMFCGVLRLSTGELRYSNAGHHPPLVARHDGTVEWLPIPEGMVLGVIPDLQYRTLTTTLHPGDTLIAYTDGVPEAHDPQATLYSDSRLFDLVTASSGSTPEAFVGAIMRSVQAHAATAAQFDDLTVLAVSLRRAPGTLNG